MKKLSKLGIIALTGLCIIALTTCFSDYGHNGMGQVTINVGGGSARSATGDGNPPVPEIENATVFTIAFYVNNGDDEPAISKDFIGIKAATMYVPAGAYSRISVTAAYKGVEYADGSKYGGYSEADGRTDSSPIVITKGKNNPISIEMNYNKQLGFDLERNMDSSYFADYKITLQASNENTDGYSLMKEFNPIIFSTNCQKAQSENKGGDLPDGINWSVELHNGSNSKSMTIQNVANIENDKLYIKDDQTPFYVIAKIEDGTENYEARAIVNPDTTPSEGYGTITFKITNPPNKSIIDKTIFNIVLTGNTSDGTYNGSIDENNNVTISNVSPDTYNEINIKAQYLSDDTHFASYNYSFTTEKGPITISPDAEPNVVPPVEVTLEYDRYIKLNTPKEQDVCITTPDESYDISSFFDVILYYPDIDQNAITWSIPNAPTYVTCDNGMINITLNDDVATPSLFTVKASVMVDGISREATAPVVIADSDTTFTTITIDSPGDWNRYIDASDIRLDNVFYNIIVNTNDTVDCREFDKNSIVIIQGNNKELTLSPNSTFKSIIKIHEGSVVYMDNLKLNGNNISEGVGVVRIEEEGGSFIMTGTSSIYGGNSKEENIGGGVTVCNGTFYLMGGEIYDNTAVTGGGVYVDTDGTFIKTGGVIRNNSANTGSQVAIKDGNNTYYKNDTLWENDTVDTYSGWQTSP